VPNGDVAAFRDAILRLLDDEALAARLGQNAQTYVRDNMSWEHAARSIEAVYDRLTLNPRKSS
jgi:glycosyltransferase involved in cell wall biosynthesis